MSLFCTHKVEKKNQTLLAVWLKRSHSVRLTKDLRPVYWTSPWVELKHMSCIVQGDSNGVMEKRIFPNHRERERERKPALSSDLHFCI